MNINNTYFSGHYKTIWKSIIPEELTKKEVEFIQSYFDLKEGSKVIDLMCGYGRHSIGLARKGMHVTAVDNLEDYYLEIKETAQKENLSITPVHADVATFTVNDKFNLAICMGNSLNFFDREDTIRILKNLNKMLLPGAQLLINTWSLAEIVIKNFNERYWSRVGDLKQLNEGKYLFQPTRIEWETWIISPDNQIENKKGIDYIFTIAEMEKILAEAGFRMKIVYSIPGRKEFTLGDPRAYIVASL
jgi:cyclopropane fatty-acyl-phospholipid synthase-like methyltransferase